MPAGRERVADILSFMKVHGEAKTLTQFGISVETLRRYERVGKKQGLIVTDYKIPKILLFDLETSPLEVYTYALYNQFISPDMVKKQSALLTYAAKWLCGDEIFTGKVSLREATNRTDGSIVKGLWKLIDEADICIAHNLKGFDAKVANTRFLINKLSPPSPYSMIDTLEQCKKVFKFPSNKLGFVNELLNIEKKIETSFKLWRGCVNGDAESLESMLKYNIQDVVALEELYFVLRPWMRSHPNLALYYDDCDSHCRNCGSTNIEKGDKYYYTNVNAYKAVRCKDCGAYMRERTSELSKEQKEKLFTNLAG